MASQPDIEVGVRVLEEEFLAWNRAALKADLDLGAWVRMVVNHRLAPKPTSEAAPPRPRALHWLEDDPRDQCEYCGWSLDVTATRRKRYCRDECRVRAWRLRKRLSVAKRSPLMPEG